MGVNKKRGLTVSFTLKKQKTVKKILMKTNRKLRSEFNLKSGGSGLKVFPGDGNRLTIYLFRDFFGRHKRSRKRGK